MPKRLPFVNLSPQRVSTAPRKRKPPSTVEQIARKKERDSFYTNRVWRRFREWFLSENPVCELCLESGVITTSKVPHHKIDRLKRPDLAYEPTNLQALCNPCHTRLHKTLTYGADTDE